MNGMQQSFSDVKITTLSFSLLNLLLYDESPSNKDLEGKHDLQTYWP